MPSDNLKNNITNKYYSAKDIPFLLLTFLVPLIFFLITSSSSLMFDDAAEFALIAKLGGIAHPPGSPSYVLFGFIWLKLVSFFGLNTIDSLNLFSSICISFSSLLLYLSFKIIATKISILNDFKNSLISGLCAIAFASSITSWAWATTIEVYALQAFALSLTLFGLIRNHFNRNNISIIIAATGLSIGLGNHHLTMLIFLPFVPIFFLENIFTPTLKNENIKKSKTKKPGILKQLIIAFQKKEFRKLTVLTFLMTISFYVWMFIRAQAEYSFMFGKPDTFDELIYHVTGSTYFEGITSVSKNIIGSRIPYFIKLTALQLFLFIPFFIVGIKILYKNKLFPFLSMILLYFFILFMYQLNNNQWSSDTNAYMLLPFLLLYFVVLYGSIFLFDKIKAQIVFPILIIVQLIYNFPGQDRRTYTVSESLMKLLDKSAPKNSIIIISDWTLIIQYYFYRITENFRPDLIVLNNDIKFDHYRILPIMYPDFYTQIKEEYDDFVDELMIENPRQATGTGCDLTTIGLATKYTTLLNKIKNIAHSKNLFFLTDPRAHYFFSSSNIDTTSNYVSGCFSSTIPGDSISNNYFLELDHEFLKSPLLLQDPSAINKLIDYQTVLNNHMNHYYTTNNVAQIEKTKKAQIIIYNLQSQMKKNISFANVTN